MWTISMDSHAYLLKVDGNIQQTRFK